MFSVTPSVGTGIIWIYFISDIFYYRQQALFTLKVSSFLWPLNDVSVDIVDDEGSFQFSHETEFTSHLQQTLKQNHCASRNCKITLKLLALKWLLTELLVETEWSEVMLIWWFVWIKFILDIS